MNGHCDTFVALVRLSTNNENLMRIGILSSELDQRREISESNGSLSQSSTVNGQMRAKSRSIQTIHMDKNDRCEGIDTESTISVFHYVVKQ